MTIAGEASQRARLIYIYSTSGAQELSKINDYIV